MLESYIYWFLKDKAEKNFKIKKARMTLYITILFIGFVTTSNIYR